MINIKFDLQDPKELRQLAKILDSVEKELDDIQENKINYFMDDYQFVFSFQYGELENVVITKKGV